MAEKKEMKPGDIVMNRDKSKHPQSPVWSGKTRLPDTGEKCEFDLWPREAKETKQKYLGGEIENLENPNDSIYEKPAKGDIALFENDRTENEKRPHLRGMASLHAGASTETMKEYTISLWEHQGKYGKFFSGKIEETEKAGEEQNPLAFDALEDNPTE